VRFLEAFAFVFRTIARLARLAIDNQGKNSDFLEELKADFPDTSMLQSGSRTKNIFCRRYLSLHTRAIGERAHWNNQSNSCLPLGARRRCPARSSILARRVTSHPCHADHVMSRRIVRIIEGLAEDWRRLDERLQGLSSIESL
jgi:hypothetical protein